MSNDITLLCLVYSPSKNAISVKVPKSFTKDVDADEPELWRVHIPVDQLITQGTNFDIKVHTENESLSPFDKVQVHFHPPARNVDITIQIPHMSTTVLEPRPGLKLILFAFYSYK